MSRIKPQQVSDKVGFPPQMGLPIHEERDEGLQRFDQAVWEMTPASV